MMKSATTPNQQVLDEPARDSRVRPKLAEVLVELGVKNRELATLYAALDNTKPGIMLLDKDLRAQYANPELHSMFKSPPEFIAGKPLYAEMLQHARRTSAYEVSQQEIDAYVARRLEWARSGDPTPVDQKLSNGRVIRSQCAMLPDGGRMLTYSDVTDIVRHSEEMEKLATTDGMTGIYNRRHFLALADHEWDRAWRYGRPLSFLMIDIDFFKSINDRFGHQVGDEIIVHLAEMARTCKRNTDVLARIGGEEFALLLPETDAHQAMTLAERLRAEVANHPLTVNSAEVPATVSIGIAAADRTMTGIADLMRAADHALYEAKRTGRNRVSVNSIEQGLDKL